MKLTKTRLEPAQLAVEETLFHTANGYFGVRGNFEEGYPAEVPTIRGSYINGFYDTVPLNYPERLYGFPEQAQRMVNLPDAQTTLLWIEGEAFSLFEGEVLSYRRELDTDEGTTRRSVHWRSPKGVEAHIEWLRMASFTRPELFLAQCTVTLPGGGTVEFCNEVNGNVTNYTDPTDPRVAQEMHQYIYPESTELLSDGGLLACRTGVSRIGLAVCQRYVTKPEAEYSLLRTEGGFSATGKVALAPGETFVLEKYTVCSDERRHAEPAPHAADITGQCMAAGIPALLEEQHNYLADFWHAGAVEIEGDDALAQGMTFNLYQLLQSAGRDDISNVSAKGLSGEGYEGHYFWDTEIYILPFFLLTKPRLARRLLDFRHRVLNGARAHARLLGHKQGALYPWRTITGSECSSYFPSGSAQYHITGDVAHSFLQYYWMSGDLEYMAEKGAEVLLETARAWLDVGHYDAWGRFCIEGVTGPDEYTCLVNNNFYTNMCARYNLLGAVDIFEQLRAQDMHRDVQQKIGLTEAELVAFQQAGEAMLLLYDESFGIHAQDDSFLQKPVWDFAGTPPENYPLLLHYHPMALYRHQVCKQADTVLAHYLFEEGTSEEVMRRSYEYYEAVTTHDSSLSACIFSIMASRLGMPEKAYAYFHNTVRTDLDNTHRNTKDGIHTANMGGAYLSVVAGFAGLRIMTDGLHFRFTLPAQWQRYRFRLWYRGSLLTVLVARDEVTLIVEHGEPVPLFIDGAHHVVKSSLTLRGVVR